MRLQHVLPVIQVLLHDDELAMINVAEILEVLDRPVIPLHEEDSRHQAVRDQDADRGEVCFAKTPPQAFIEARDAIVGICSTLAVWYTVEEVAVVCSLLPHALL